MLNSWAGVSTGGLSALNTQSLTTAGYAGTLIAVTHRAPDDGADIAVRLRLAQEAFDRFYAMCFWSWARNTIISPALLPNVAHALRNYGGRQQWLLSEQICPSTLYKARYLPPCEAGETPTDM